MSCLHPSQLYTFLFTIKQLTQLATSLTYQQTATSTVKKMHNLTSKLQSARSPSNGPHIPSPTSVTARQVQRHHAPTRQLASSISCGQLAAYNVLFSPKNTIQIQMFTRGDSPRVSIYCTGFSGLLVAGESLFFRLLLKNGSLSSNLICGSSRKGRICVTAIC